jgi:hypothetical protein
MRAAATADDSAEYMMVKNDTSSAAAAAGAGAAAGKAAKAAKLCQGFTVITSAHHLWLSSWQRGSLGQAVCVLDEGMRGDKSVRS